MNKLSIYLLAFLALIVYIQKLAITDYEKQITQLSTQNNALWGRVEFEEKKYEEEKLRSLEACERIAVLEKEARKSREIDYWNHEFADNDPVIVRLRKD